ncbi:methyltransferase domain-containing protein [Patescibacteria group bacterium]|nr:methyltransferase domain-containing protein [Patescibacteria group bacterium]
MNSRDNLIFNLKNSIKQYPKLFYFLNHTLGTFVGKSAKQSIAHLPEGSKIINVGSGANIIRKDVINVDYAKYPGVKVVADAHNLPFEDNSIDAVICESLLEHVKDPKTVISGIYRVLKPGGMVYISAPFIIPFHSSPHDYYRWTDSGLRELLKDFQEAELGILIGPTNALTYILREWLALVMSFNINTLRQFWVLFFMVLFAPINLLDHIFSRFNAAKDISHFFYYIGTKK